MSKLLALDTSTDACSVALWLDGELIEDFRVAPRQHTALLLPMVEEILLQAGVAAKSLDAIAVGRGPGSFTGIRIATGVAQGIAYAAGIPIVAVSTLEALALQAVDQQNDTSQVVALLDARMNEIYAACYHIESGLPVLQGVEQVMPPEEWERPENTVTTVGVGSGWHYFSESDPRLQGIQCLEEVVYPAAGAMARLATKAFSEGKAVNPADAMPIYLRDEVAWKKKDQQ